MAFLAVPGAARVSLVYQISSGKPIVTTFWVGHDDESAGPWVAGDLQVLAADVGSTWGIQFPAITWQGLILDHVIAQDWSVVGGTAGRASVGIQGTDVADPEPIGVAMVLSRFSAFAGRSFRNRMYWPGATETRVDSNGRWAVTYSGGIANKYNLLKAGWATDLPDRVAVIASPKLGTYALEQNVLPRAIPHYQRRRANV